MKQIYAFLAFMMFAISLNAQYIYNDYDANQNVPFLAWPNMRVTVANPAADHSSEETPSVVNPEPETGEDETPDAVSENQSETPESINPDAGDQSEDAAPPAMHDTEIKAGGDDEATEEASEETSPSEGDEALPQDPETVLPQVDEDIPTLKAKIAELQEALPILARRIPTSHSPTA